MPYLSCCSLHLGRVARERPVRIRETCLYPSFGVTSGMHGLCVAIQGIGRYVGDARIYRYRKYADSIEVAWVCRFIKACGGT